MKRITTILIITMLLLLPLFSMPVYADIAENNAGHPGGTWQDDGNAHIGFVENDAYETHVLNEPYEFLSHLWPAGFNQRVTVMVSVPDLILGAATQINVREPVYARLIQKKDWVNETYSKYFTDSDIHNTTWHKFYWTDTNPGISGSWVWNDQEYVKITFAPTDLPSSKFYPGKFEIDIKIGVEYYKVYHTSEVRYKIWGLFTPGTMFDARLTHKPDPNNPNTYTSVHLDFGIGQWYVYFYYVKGPDYFNVNQGNVSGKNGFTPQLLNKWGPYHNKDSTDLEYHFTNSSPAGMYMWVIRNEWNDEIYNFLHIITYNNYSVLNPNGTTNNAPRIEISLGEKGVNYYVNDKLPVTITAYATNSGTLKAWIIVWYGNSIFYPSPPSPSLQFFLYPIMLQSGVSHQMNITLEAAGQFNIQVFVQDSYGASNDTMAEFQVKEGFNPGGGGGNNNNTCFMWPWESTLNMVILLLGVIMMFSGKRTFQMLGILLFFAAFVDWTCIAQQLKAGLNPFNWFKEVWQIWQR